MIAVRVRHTRAEVREQLPDQPALLEIGAVRCPDQLHSDTATGKVVDKGANGAFPLDHHERQDLVSAAGETDTELGDDSFQAAKRAGGKNLGNPHRLTDGFLVICDYGRTGN